jgi:hypothetical protein
VEFRTLTPASASRGGSSSVPVEFRTLTPVHSPRVARQASFVSSAGASSASLQLSYVPNSRVVRQASFSSAGDSQAQAELFHYSLGSR